MFKWLIIIKYHTKIISFIGTCFTLPDVVSKHRKECMFPFKYKGQDNITKCIKPTTRDEYICPTDNPQQFDKWFGTNGFINATAGVCEAFGCERIKGIINDTALLLLNFLTLKKRQCSSLQIYVSINLCFVEEDVVTKTTTPATFITTPFRTIFLVS